MKNGARKDLKENQGRTTKENAEKYKKRYEKVIALLENVSRFLYESEIDIRYWKRIEIFNDK